MFTVFAAVLLGATLIFCALILLTAKPDKVISNNIQFKDFVLNKEQYYSRQFGDYLIFENGVVIYRNSTKNMAIIAPLPLKAEGLTDSEYTAVMTNDPVNAGDTVNVKGFIKRVVQNRTASFYVKADSISVTGKINVSDPDFRNLDAIAKAEDDDFMDFWIDYVYLNPTNPLSPLSATVQQNY